MTTTAVEYQVRRVVTKVPVHEYLVPSFHAYSHRIRSTACNGELEILVHLQRAMVIAPQFECENFDACTLGVGNQGVHNATRGPLTAGARVGHDLAYLGHPPDRFGVVPGPRAACDDVSGFDCHSEPGLVEETYTPGGDLLACRHAKPADSASLLRDSLNERG